MTTTRRTAWAFALGLAVLSAAPPASANGRYPYAQQLVVDPDPARLWMRATYGVLQTSDSSATWTWLCETAIGYGNGEDPFLLVTADGTLHAATAHGLLSTRDGGCTFQAQPDIGDRYVADLAATPDTSRLFALATDVQQNGDFDLQVWLSSDGGTSFAPTGPVVSKDLSALTVDVAPSDATRLYVTGLPIPRPLPPDAAPAEEEPSGVLLRSSDGGETWTKLTVPGSTARDWPYIAAVHPTNPDELYVRIRGRPRPRTEFIESVLLHSEDAGETWKEIFRANADLLGFALGASGAPVWLGLGDSHDPSLQRSVDPAVLGLYRSEAKAGPFDRLQEGPVGCVTRAGDDLYVCRTQALAGYELGISTDEGRTLSPVLALGPQVTGPLSCEPSTENHRACAAQWQTQCAVLGECETPGDAGTDADAAAPPVKREEAHADCNCRSATGTASAPWTACAALALGLLRRGRAASRGRQRRDAIGRRRA